MNRKCNCKIAKLAGINQPSVNRYEKGLTSPSLSYMIWYADDALLKSVADKLYAIQKRDNSELPILKKEL